MPAAMMISGIILITDPLRLERVFSFNTSLSVIIELAVGLTVIALLLRGSAM